MKRRHQIEFLFIHGARVCVCVYLLECLELIDFRKF